MGNYKANRNNNDVVQDTKTQDKRNEYNFAKNIKNAGEVLKKAPHPYAKAAGYAISGLDKITNGKSSQTMGKIANKATKFSPVGKQIQNASNAISESGVSNAVGDVASKINGSPTNKSEGTSKVNDNLSRFNGLKSTFNKSTSTNGDLLGNLWGKLPKGIKIKIAVGGGCCLLLLLMVFTVFAQDDIQNLSLTNNTALSGSGSNRRKCTSDEVVNNLIYVGDSRIVGLEAAINNKNVTCIAKVSMGLKWLKNTASAELDTVLQEKTSGIVVLALGINDLYNIDNYISYYKELITKYPSTKFYILSVNPVVESKARANGYSTTNADIEDFNKKLADNFSNNYIDTYSSLNNIGTSDGLHYDNETYKTLNNLVASNISNSGQVMCGGGDALAKLAEQGQWWVENVDCYFTRCGGNGYIDDPFYGGSARKDCSGFASAYMGYVAGVGTSISISDTLTMINPNSSWSQNVQQYNWKYYLIDEISELQPGDVLLADNRSFPGTKGQHAEIYVDESHTFGWGSVKNAYPTNNTLTKSTKAGRTVYSDSNHDYVVIYRYEGAISSDSSNSSSSSSLNATNMNDSSFNHGTKPKSNQKYIMLHDTEMSQDAKTVVQAWKNSGSGVAAHFVIDRDGTIIQAVELDTITHHAGPGGPGNYDAKFGVGNNDGKGNGDDLIGNPTGKGNYASYTSYGMNSYSIGIEMCHVNGETYPEAQLEAVDKVIAYIDSYYGFNSIIIDHKEWRPSNSDTDANFATYLNNYKTLRHH